MISSFIDVRFYGRDPDASLASSIHRCIARLARQDMEVHRAAVAIQSEARRRTRVTLSLTLADGQLSVAATCHADPYVAIADAFDAAERRLCGTRRRHVARAA